MSTIRMRISPDGDMLNVRGLIRHEMETGMGDEPADYINKLYVKVNGDTKVDANLSAGVSRNPFIEFNVPGGAGDEVTLEWQSNTGESDSASQEA